MWVETEKLGRVDYSSTMIARAKPDPSAEMAVPPPLVLAAMGMCGEAGEFSEFIKKWAFHGVVPEREKLLKELGDVLWYVNYGAACLGVTLEAIAEMNADKIVARYPDGFTKGGGIRAGKGAA
jgi:NTP pyrophosphatase (non-canonical NTP hydrolase)